MKTITKLAILFYGKKKQTLFLKMSGKQALKGLKKLNDKERAVIG